MSGFTRERAPALRTPALQFVANYKRRLQAAAVDPMLPQFALILSTYADAFRCLPQEIDAVARHA